MKASRNNQELVTALAERIRLLETRLGEPAEGQISVQIAVRELSRDLRVIIQKNGGSMERLCRYALEFNRPRQENDTEMRNWFSRHYNDLLNLVHQLVDLDSRIHSSLDQTVSCFASNIPSCRLRLEDLHQITSYTVRLVLNSCLVIRRILSLAVEEEQLFIDTYKRVNRLKGTLNKIETKNVV